MADLPAHLLLAWSMAPPARRIYARLRRWLEGALVLVFGCAGLRMLLSRTPGG